MDKFKFNIFGKEDKTLYAFTWVAKSIYFGVCAVLLLETFQLF